MTSSPGSDLPVTIAEIRAAAERLQGKAWRTPLLESPPLNVRLGLRLLVKAECLQRTGSFKFRGAYNALAQLGPAQRRAGVVAYSSGNHAQGVAAAAQLLGIPALIVMPADAPAVKIANTRGYGAEIVFYDRNRESREAIAAGIARERGAAIVPPYDHPHVIAGQGTAALEIVEQTASLGTAADIVIANASGGGLVAGCAVACAALSPGTAVYCAEPARFDDHARSLAAGRRLANEGGGASICDALLAPTPGEITFEVNRRLLKAGLSASDDEVRGAIRTAFEELRIVVEPGGAVGLAAAIKAAPEFQGKTVIVVASGGNVDPAIFAAAITGSQA